MNKQISFCALGAVAGVLSLPVAATGPATYAVDFAGAGVPQGWTVENGEYRSPEYSNAVDRIELRYSGADAAASATISAFPKQGDGTSVATLSAASSGASFDFPETTDFRSFRIAVNGLALTSFAAYVSADMLGMPSGVAISNNVTGTSFDASWYPVDGATGYRVYVWTNAVVGASAGTAVWQETMSGATNASSNTKMSDDKFAGCFENSGWTRSDKAGYPTGENGTVRIGTTGDSGWLQTPPIVTAADDLAVRFYAKAVDTKSNGKRIAVERILGETAAFVGTVTLSLEMQEFVIPLPDWESGDCIRFNSITNGDRRVIIGAVTVVSGYSEGSLEPSYIQNVDVGLATVCSFTGLPSVPVQFAVEAYGRRGVTSEKTEAVEVDLANPEKVPQLNACPLSSLVGNTYTQNFDSLAALTVPTGDKDWLNGTTLPYWQAYKDVDAVSSFNFNAGNGSTGGLYVFATNRNDLVRALGAYSTQNDEFSFGLAFTNDTESAMTLSSVVYLAQQWGFANTTNQTMSVSAKVVDGLDWISAYSDGWTELGSTQSTVFDAEDAHDTPVSTPVAATPAAEISIAPGQVLMLKWTIHSLKSGKPGMMGIDEVTVTFSNKPRGFVIKLAGTPRAP